MVASLAKGHFTASVRLDHANPARGDAAVVEGDLPVRPRIRSQGGTDCRATQNNQSSTNEQSFHWPTSLLVSETSPASMRLSLADAAGISGASREDATP